MKSLMVFAFIVAVAFPTYAFEPLDRKVHKFEHEELKNRVNSLEHRVSRLEERKPRMYMPSYSYSDPKSSGLRGMRCTTYECDTVVNFDYTSDYDGTEVYYDNP